MHSKAFVFPSTHSKLLHENTSSWWPRPEEWLYMLICLCFGKAIIIFPAPSLCKFSFHLPPFHASDSSLGASKRIATFWSFKKLHWLVLNTGMNADSGFQAFPFTALGVLSSVNLPGKNRGNSLSCCYGLHSICPTLSFVSFIYLL